MSKKKHFLTILVLLFVIFENVFCDSGNQPRIVSRDGDLVFESGQDRNITIRLKGASVLMINDVDVLDAIQKVSLQLMPDDDINIASLPGFMDLLKTDLRSLTSRLSRLENRTDTAQGRIRRLMARVRALVRRVNELESKLKEDDCSPSPCKNGGMCYDLYENFHCECPDAWTGKTCEQDVDECYAYAGTELGCQHNSECVNTPGSYRCICKNGFKGIHCQELGNDCATSRPGELCGHGTCVPANNQLGYQCICDAGWKLDNQTQSCSVDVNECLEMLVACHTSCINLPGSFMCGPCPNGYTGNGVKCQDIDECVTNNGGCSTSPKVQCINTEGSHRCGNCPPGWTGDGHYCSQAETNDCITKNICHPLARCEYISNTAVCVCPTGMTGSGYGPAGCRSGSANPCNDHHCQNGGTCVSHGSSYTCICAIGFMPPYCHSMDVCASSPCMNGGTCVRLSLAEFRCDCPRSTTGNVCQEKRNSCGSVLRERSGELIYPFEGGQYQPNAACAWVIHTTAGKVLNVTFTHFDVESDPECNRDWLQLNDGRSLATPLIGRFCGNQLPRGGNIVTSQNSLFLWFRTDNATSATGFRLNWNSTTAVCDERKELRMGDHGVIKSPGYPGKSPPNRECLWTLSAPFGRRILLQFYEIVMDPSNNCSRNSIIIYDTNEVLEQICDSGIPAAKYTSSSMAKIHFSTDWTRETSLFQVHYEVVPGRPGCGGLFTEPQGKLTITFNMGGCLFLIQQPPGTRIRLSIRELQAIFVQQQFLKVFDGKTEDDPVLLDLRRAGVDNITSTGNFMLIRITIPVMDSTYLAFSEATYRQVCGGDFNSPGGGSFSTPNYPQPYYTGLMCEYVFFGELNSIVHINITDYDVSEYPDTCDDTSDYIKFFYTINGPGERYCKGSPMHVVSISNYLRIEFHSQENPQRRRGITGTYNFEAIGCGGVLRDIEGRFEQLDVTSLRYTFCQWILEAPPNHVVSLDLKYGQVGRLCSHGDAVLRIYLNRTEGVGELIESYCGPEKHILTTVQSNLVTIFLKLIDPSESSALEYSLIGKYKFVNTSTVCSFNYTTLSGYIHSPGWPRVYGAYLNCEWVIHAPLGHKIELVVKNFTLEDGQCANDFLEIRNGPSKSSPLIGTYCGTEIPSHIPSFTNHLYLRLRTDSTVEYPGFQILYRQMATGCGGSLHSHSGSIASPHYPEISRGPVQCDWRIFISQGSVIELQITKLTPEADFCSSNVLTIYDGDNPLSKPLQLNCSDSDPLISLTSSTNVVHIRYALPSVGAADGEQFYLAYNTNCHRTLNSFSGVIESPNFPSNYPSSLTCEWNIIGRSTDTFNLTFSHFELEANDVECVYDLFEVIDMKGEEELQTHRICRDPPDVLSSTGNRLLLKFRSDYKDAGNGFRLEFKRNGCGGYYIRESAIFASPKVPYSVDMDCEWVIEVAPMLQIILDIFDVHIDSPKTDCSSNGLIVKNEKDDDRDLLKECKVDLMPMTVSSQGNKMYVRFYSDSVRARKYFKASYRTRESSCGGLFRGNSGVITSPNYPQNYPKGAYCAWFIRIESISYVEFTFEDLSFPFGSNCSNGAVEAYDNLNKELIVRTCSDGIGVRYKTKSNMLNVILKSHDGQPAKGFLMRYKKSCSGLLTASSQFLKSYVTDELCKWTIKANDTGAKITLHFMKIECSCGDLNVTECHKTRGIEVTTTSGTTLLSFCDHHQPDFMSDSQELMVIARNILFIGRYSTVETTCGGTLTSLRGSFASPYYPESYPSNIECMWTIKAALGSYLELSIQEMDIAKSDGCNEDYLEIRETNSIGKLLGLFCSDKLPEEKLRAFQQVWVKFRSSENSIGKSFKVSWTHAQLNEIGGFAGRILAPPIVALRSETNPFQWRITVTSENVIKLSFKEYNGGLQLYDGYDNTALPIDIQLSPWDVTSSMNVIYLVSDNQLLDRFEISWQSVAKTPVSYERNSSDCGGTMVVKSDSTEKITSPGYPNGYGENLNCKWLLKPTTPEEHAVVTVNDVRLEFVGTCSVDYLKISSSPDLENWNEVLRVCDNSQINVFPKTKVHGTPYLKLELITDASINRTGFEASVFSACGGNLTGLVGRISNTIFHPERIHISTKKLNCTWHVKVPSGLQIRFNFQFPSNPNAVTTTSCTGTYALIRDGIDDGAPILPPGRICATTRLNETITTTSNRATIRYILEDFNPFLPINISLFNLTYRAFSDCGGDVRLTSYSKSVVINSPNYPNVPNPHVECVWTIVAPPGMAIQAQSVDLFDMNTRKCNDEFIEFRDGGTRLAPLISKYCTRPPAIRSSGNVLYIRYRTDIAEPRNGFKLNVTLTQCGGTFTQFKGTVSSTNYPAPGGYPSNSVCDYVIKIPEFYHMNLNFTDIHLPYNASNINASERIEIYQVYHRAPDNSTDAMTVLYGNTTTMPLIEVDTSTVLIRFVTFQANNVYRGFSLKYERMYGSCSKDVTGESGTITSRLIPRRPPLFALCRYRITVPKGRRVKARALIAEPISGRDHFFGTRSFTAIFCNDFMMTSKIVTFDFNNLTSNRYVSSTDNQMFIRILGPQLFTPYTLQVEYSSPEVSPCPDDITSDTGTISIATLDKKENFYCTSDIVLNGRETLVVNITQLTITSASSRLSMPAIRFMPTVRSNQQQLLTSNLTNSRILFSVKHGSMVIMQNEVVKLDQFEATYMKYPCGGEFRLGGQFSISFANLSTSTQSLDCVWTFTFGSANLYDVFANLSFSLPCEDEYLILHMGPSIDELQVAKLCKGLTFNTSRIKMIPFYVTYHTAAYNPGNPMRVDIQEATVCGGRLDIGLQQSIGIGSKDYKNNIECVWDIYAKSGLYLRLEFIGRFFIESSNDCVKDYIELRKQEKGLWMSMGRFCGRDKPPSINTTVDRLQMIFRTDDAITGDGFSITVRSTCDVVLNVTHETQMIRYPERWSINRSRLKCNYVLQTYTDDYIEVKFKRFALKLRNACSMRQMIVQKWSTATGELTTLDPWCTSDSATDLRAKKMIKLSYQDAIEAGDYLIEYSLSSCGGTITYPGVVESMKNEDGSIYASNMRCVWNITAPDDRYIFIQFKYLVMEESQGCMLDYVAVYREWDMKKEHRLGKLCGNLTANAPSFFIEDERAVLVAISDPSVELRGFQAMITFNERPERLSLSEANTPVNIDRDFMIEGPSTIYTYRVIAPSSHRIQIELREVIMNGENITCNDECENCNFIEVLNSFRSGHFPFGRYCRADQVKSKIVTAFNDAVIRINFERQGQYKVRMTLQLVRSLCGNQSEFKLDEESGVQLFSPKTADGKYPANIHCTWKFFSSQPFELQLAHLNLQAESDVTGKCLDYVHILYTTSTSTTRKTDEHCGIISSYTIPIDSLTSDYSADVTFHSDEAVESTGFTLVALRKPPCNRVYVQLSGTFRIEILEEMTCFNYITLSENYTINIIQTSLSYNSDNCSVNYLRIYDNHTKQQINENCDFQFGTKKSSFTTNRIRLELKAPPHLTMSISYYGSPRSPLAGCGGDIQTPTGIIFNPDYPSYRNKSTCRWNLTTTTTNRFELYFHEFNMGSVCKTDYVDIYEIAKDGRETLARHHCESVFPQVYESNSNRIAIVSVASAEFDGTGWQISFNIKDSNGNSFMDAINQVIFDPSKYVGSDS